jgi:hypothetical protein
LFEDLGLARQKESSHGEYVGLDVSMEETSVRVMAATGEIVWEGRVASEPRALAQSTTASCPSRDGGAGEIAIGVAARPQLRTDDGVSDLDPPTAPANAMM